MDPITTLQQLETLKQTTLVWAVIICVLAFAISFVIATLIPYKGGKDTSHITRRLWYIIVGVLAAAAFWIYNFLMVTPVIMNPGFQSQFAKTNLVCVAIIVVGYVIIGILVAFIFRKSKFSTVFLKHKK